MPVICIHVHRGKYEPLGYEVTLYEALWRLTALM